MNAHHLRFFLRQYIEHKDPANLRLHVVSNALSWLALCAVFSQVPLPGLDALPPALANLGAAFAALSVLYWAPVDPLLSLGIGLYTAAFAAVPGVPWGPPGPETHSLWVGVAPLLVFIAGGLSALFAHMYYHEHCSFLADEPKGRAAIETTHAVIWGPFHFWLEGLLAAGYRPKLRAELDAAERAAILRRRNVPWSCWGETASAEPAVVCVPQTSEDVRDVVREAVAAGRNVRVVASGFTWPSFSATGDYLLFTERLCQVEIDRADPANPVVWAGAGTTNRQLNAALAAQGLTLPYNVVLETVRIGGLVSVGTHGSGRETATMSDLVLALEVVDAQGELRVLSAETLGEEGMRAARMAFGLFGIITRVRLKVEPLFAVVQNDSLHDEGEVLARLPELVARHDSVELFWMPYTDRLWLRTLDRLPAGDRRRPERLGFLFMTSHFFQMLIFIGGLRRMAPRFPALAPALMRLGVRFLLFRERVLAQADAQHFRRWVELAKCRCVEVAFKCDPAMTGPKAAWLDTRRLVEEKRKAGEYPLNLAVNMRFVGPSDALLSPAFGPGVSCYVEALSVHETQGWEAFSAELATAWLAQPGALPHWAKEFEGVPNIERLARERLGDRLTRFHTALRAAGVDATGRFANALTRRVGFSPEGGR